MIETKPRINRKAKLCFTSTWPNHVKKNYSILYLKRSTVQNIKANNLQGTAQRKCCKYTQDLSAVWGNVIKKIELYLSLLSNDLLTIIRDYVGWSLAGDRKRNNRCNFCPKIGRGLLRNLSGGRSRESS